MNGIETYLDRIICGDCREILPTLPADSIDTVITDAPYELGFMGKAWDKTGIAYDIEMWREVLRVAKPGATLLCFGGTRTFHRIACAIEDAGWIIKDTMMWIYGSGFPKSMDIGKAVDKLQGNEREIVKAIDINHLERGDRNIQEQNYTRDVGVFNFDNEKRNKRDNTTTKGTSEWEGWGTALKPAYESLIVAIKHLDGTYAQNALKWGVAGINVDGGRIEYVSDADKKKSLAGDAFKRKDLSDKGWSRPWMKDPKRVASINAASKIRADKGRFPANVILDEEAGRMLDEQSGTTSKTGNRKNPLKEYHQPEGGEWFGRKNHNGQEYQDSGGASRFFYCPKVSKAERNMGLGGLEAKQKVFNGKSSKSSKDMKGVERKFTTLPSANTHPTVKPLKLMEYLCTLTKTPTAGIVLDPFAGSGSTCIAAVKTGRHYIGIEHNPEYCDIARKRVNAVHPKLGVEL